tara:strand:- start:60 stop:476 length:417 start_codon:yes stop_codon:yes gene_type:complete
MPKTWLYQVRIHVTSELAQSLRENADTEIAMEIDKIASHFNTRTICIFDAFNDYCLEAEKNGPEFYPLYQWTKETLADPEKKKKHLCSFAFYLGEEQVYEKSTASGLKNALSKINSMGNIKEIKLVDSNPENNPQPNT